MPTWEFIAGANGTGGTQDSAQNGFRSLGGGNAFYATENASQIKVFSTYTWANLYVRVISNTFTGGNTTIRSRIGGVNGNQLVTIAGGTTGVFQDTTNTDALVSGNLIDWNSICQTEVTKTIKFGPLGSTLLDASTNNTLDLAAGDAANTAFGVTGYAPIGGDADGGGGWVTTEADVQYTIRRATTYSNLRVFIKANTINSGTTTITFRDNNFGGGNGAQTLSIGFGATGAFEDTTNSDVVSAGDKIDQQMIASGTSGVIQTTIVQMAHTSVGREMVASTPGGQSTGADSYNVAEGYYLPTLTEADSQIAARAAFTGKNLFVNVKTHGATSGVNVFLRQNTANSTLTVNIPSSTTGLFEDTTNQVSIAVADVYNYLIDRVGGANTIVITVMGIEQGLISGGGYPTGMFNRHRPRRSQGRGLRVP